MVILSLLVAVATALVAHGFRARVRGFCVHFGLLPGFAVRIGDAAKLSRRARIWLHAAPLLLRLGLAGVGILLWFNTRNIAGIWAPLGLSIAGISALAFLFAASPLVKSSAYHLMSAYLDEPYMRRRSRQVLLGKLRGGSYAKVENDVLAAYSLASTAYVLLVVAMLLLLLGRVFELHLGGVVFLPLAVIAVPVAWRMIGKFREIARSFERKAQFQRWRKGDLPKGEAESEGKIHLNSFARYSLRSFGLLLLVVLILPYDHEIGGGFVVLPQEKQDITSEVSGIIESINYDGGEVLRQGTVIGRLSCTDYNAQVKILSAKIAEQDAVIAELKARPRPEEVELAESNLRTEETRARFSKEELARMEKLYAEKTVSFEDLEDARREHELDVKRVAEKRASLELIKAGATPDEITAAEAKLQSWEEERRLYLEKIEKSVFYTPLEGTLVAMHLKQKIGSYFERGQPLATVENTQQVIVQIDVAEEDIGYIRDKAKVRVRFPTYSEEDIDGTVTLIGPTVTEGSAGRVLQITAQIENRDGKLKSGMEGYAKISCGSLPVWKVLTLGVIRFFNIEAWSWLP
jgi:putative peptide zinc metalloprotease protein